MVAGCGEAFDDTLPNTSLLVHTGGASLLLDCGYSVPPALWKLEPDASALDLIYISHAHADHYFGLPPLLGRMWEEGRTKPLVVMSQACVLENFRQIMELGYRGLRDRFQFKIDYRAVAPDSASEFGSLRFRFAPTMHSTTNLAIRIEDGAHAVCYSGDGNFTEESQELYAGADLLFHECYSFEASPIHGEVREVLAMAGAAGVRKAALMHVRRDVRKHRSRLFEAMLAAEVRCILPRPGDVLFL